MPFTFSDPISSASSVPGISWRCFSWRYWSAAAPRPWSPPWPPPMEESIPRWALPAGCSGYSWPSACSFPTAPSCCSSRPSPCRPAYSCFFTAPSNGSTASWVLARASRTSPIWAAWSGVTWSWRTGGARIAGDLGHPPNAEPVSAADHVHQFSEAVHHVIFHLIRRDFGEEFPGAFDFAFFDFPQLQRRHAALGL